ncbi:MAG TPA: DUF1801 domain-containing protein [Vicinamibacterales bacterium]|jgi:hypothetical protein
MPTRPTTVQEFMNSLSDDRRSAIETVRKVIVDNLPRGYEESMGMGMLMYSVPLSVCPDTYNGHPLCYAALSSHKSYMSIHLMPLYADKKAEQRFRSQFKASGKKLDMGKACVHFKAADDLPLDVIGGVIASIPMDKWVSVYRSSRKPASSRAKSAARGTRAAKARARPRAEKRS